MFFLVLCVLVKFSCEYFILCYIDCQQKKSFSNKITIITQGVGAYKTLCLVLERNPVSVSSLALLTRIFSSIENF